MNPMTVLGAAAIAAFLAIQPVSPAAEPDQDMTYVGDYRITAFNYYEGDGENYYTAGGWEPVPYYTVAACEEFELGTMLYIDGVGVVQVQDRGNFPADRLDIHIGYDPIESWNDCYRAVYLIDGGEQ